MNAPHINRRRLLYPLVAGAFAIGMLMSTKNVPMIGLESGRLKECPDRPNCVSSQSKKSDHQIEPLTFPDLQVGWNILHDVMAAYPRTTIIEATDGYLHCECRTRILRFVDDVEFLMAKEEAVIHVRSASRLGYSDLGANRARVDDIRRICHDRMLRQDK